VNCDRTMVFSEYSVSPKNKTDRQDITKIPLKEKVEDTNGVMETLTPSCRCDEIKLETLTSSCRCNEIKLGTLISSCRCDEIKLKTMTSSCRCNQINLETLTSS
jgi:hypothetical protein